MSSQNISLLGLTIRATGAITKYRFVTAAGAHPTQPGQVAFGVACFGGVAGDDITVETIGTAKLEAGGAVAIGDLLETDASGRAVKQSTTYGIGLARALQAASSSGDLIEAFLLPTSSDEHLIAPITAAGAITANRFINATGTQAGAGENAIGVARVAGVTSNVIPTNIAGVAYVSSGAAVSAGALLESDASGRAITRTSGAILGRAITAAGAADELIKVLLIAN
jgi:hypothetical protein